MTPPVNIQPVTIRPATPEDDAWAAPLIQATIGPVGRALTGAASDEEAAGALRPFFRRGGNRLGFERVLVAELAGVPAGLAVSYPGDLAEALDEPFRARLLALGRPGQLQTEAAPDEWYLDTLATRPEFRGRGVGSALLDAVAEGARRAGWSRLGLLVEPDNAGARRLYQRHGFVEVGGRSLYGLAFLHLRRERVD